MPRREPTDQLREADIGIAMGASGTDVAREAADLVLLDDRFATIVTAVEYGRATFANIRRFLTYQLTDNVAELAPFLLRGLTAGAVPPALGVLLILTQHRHRNRHAPGARTRRRDRLPSGNGTDGPARGVVAGRQ